MTTDLWQRSQEGDEMRCCALADRVLRRTAHIFVGEKTTLVQRITGMPELVLYINIYMAESIWHSIGHFTGGINTEVK